MALPSTLFTTGPAPSMSRGDPRDDVQALSYNGCTFSPLFETRVHGQCVKDNAHRTVKLMEYTISIDGYATLPDNATSIKGVMNNLRTLLTQQAGTLVYTGRGLDMVINPQGGGVGGSQDVAWGPVPELFEFQPLGGGRSAKVQWQVKVRVPETTAQVHILGTIGGGNQNIVPLLQFNYDTSVAYDEAGYSSLSMRGTMEIGMTRTPTQQTRMLTNTVDDFREQVERRVMSGIDLTRFHILRREFSVSRDKRTLEWVVEAEEKGYMDLPPDATVARGSYTVRPARAGMGLCLWLCTLRCTYVIRHDRPRRFAWFAFLTLLRRRMVESRHGKIPKEGDPQNPPRRGVLKVLNNLPIVGEGFKYFGSIFNSQGKNATGRNAWLIDFSFDEGIYLDSRTVSFSATWRLTTLFSHILLASGLWTKIPDDDVGKSNVWATSVKDISGSKSWLTNRVDSKLDVIVDFGGG